MSIPTGAKPVPGVLKRAGDAYCRTQKDFREFARGFARATDDSFAATTNYLASSPDASAILRTMVITHPEKVLFPDDGITKGDVATYYETIAPLMLPHLAGRPVTMERYPSGIAKNGFWQKDVVKGFPSWLDRVEVPKKDGTVHHLLVNDARALLWMANQNTITPHVWVSRVPELYYPDVCVFDLDPPDATRGDTVRAIALALRELLRELGLQSWIKTTGSKGFHVLVSLDGAENMGEVARFAHRVGAMLTAAAPKHVTQEFSKADRGGRILIDTGRNGYSATFAAAYALRARPGAPVSAPCTWEEIESGTIEPGAITLRNVSTRIAAVGDVWSGFADDRQSLRQAIDRLGSS